jgi:Uma2 family endonuclease
MNALTISLEPIFELTEEKFFQLCQKNSDLRFERSAQGDITIMAPEGSDTGMRSSNVNGHLWLWNQQKKLGFRKHLRMQGRTKTGINTDEV